MAVFTASALTDKQLDAPVELCVVRWEGRIHCVYLNDFRIAGGKPWGGGSTEKEWKVSLREVIRAFPELQAALGFDYLGKRVAPADQAPVASAILTATGEPSCPFPTSPTCPHAAR